MNDSSYSTIRDEWCKDCMRFPCNISVEECKLTPPVTVEQIYGAMVKCGEANLSSQPRVTEETDE